MLRTDVEKKDKLISDLSSVRESKVKFSDPCKVGLTVAKAQKTLSTPILLIKLLP